VFIKPAVDNAFVVGIDRAKNTGKYLEGKLISNPELDPETPGAEVIECNLTKVFGGNLSLSFHPSPYD